MPACLAHTLAAGSAPCSFEAEFISDTRVPICSGHRAALESADRILGLLKIIHVPLTFTPIDEPEAFVVVNFARLEFRLLIHALSAISHYANLRDADDLLKELNFAVATVNQLGAERWDALLSQLVRLTPAFPGVTVQTRDISESSTSTENLD